MKDEKNEKKNNNSPKTTNKKNNKKRPNTNNVKNNNKGKTTLKKNQNTPKKAETKKTTPVKEEVKKVEKKEEVKRVEPKKETPKKVEPKKEEQLEKTLVFDGKQNENLEEVVTKLEKDNVVLKDKVIKRSKAKKVIIVLLVLLIIGIIIVNICYVVNEQKTKELNTQTINSNIYDKINTSKERAEKKEIEQSTYSNIERISLGDFEEKVLNKEDMIILIASETCYGCVTYEPTVNEVFTELDKTVYEIDVSRLTSDEMNVFRKYYHFKTVPTIFYIKDGIVVNDLTSSQSKEDLQAWLDEAL